MKTIKRINMKKLRILLSALAVLTMTTACLEKDGPVGMKILLLKVDYTTNRLEGGAWLPIERSPKTFTTRFLFKDPGDFGWIKVYFSEVEELLFHGDIVWTGHGDIIYPDKWLDADEFEHVTTYDYFTPRSGFENIVARNTTYDYEFTAWSGAQGLVDVRRILREDPQQVVKLFLYTPNMGLEGDPEDWKWIIFLADKKQPD
jgi:hypothetical protein